MFKSLLKSVFYRFGYSICKVRPVAASGAMGADAGGNRLMPLIHARSPYQDFPLAEYPADLQGWGSQSVAFDTLLARLKPRRIIEVGTWKGGSAIHMAKVAQGLGLAPEIICVVTRRKTLNTPKENPERVKGQGRRGRGNAA